MTSYNKTQSVLDKKRGVFSVEDICFDNGVDICFTNSEIWIAFENGADSNKIEEVIFEIANMDVVDVPNLMTREALCLWLNAPSYVLECMDSMPVGSSFEYDGNKIVRRSNLTYTVE